MSKSRDLPVALKDLHPFEIFADMILPLIDGHVAVGSEEAYVESATQEIFETLVEEYISTGGDADPYEYVSEQLELMHENTFSYLQDEPKGDIETLVWGHLDAAVGYIFISYFVADPEEYNEMLEQALKDLKHTDMLIVDIRINFGGSDDLAFFSLSNEIYRSMDGELFEGVGIPTDLPLSPMISNKTQREAGIDVGLEMLLGY